jgi:hypothetical protein
MTREHGRKPDAQHGNEAEGGDDGAAIVNVAQRKSAQERRLANQARAKLNAHIANVSKSTLLGANLFQKMVRGDAEEALRRKLEPAMAEKLGEKVLEKVLDKLKDTLVEVTDVGKEMAEKASAVFGAIKSNITEKIKTRGELTAQLVADDVTSGLIEAQGVVEDRLRAAVDALPPEKLAEIARILFKLREASKDAEDDSPEHGKLADGMEAWAMTDLLGLPAGDGVAAEEVALQAYSVFREGVRETAMSAGEASTDIQRQLTHPNDDKDKLEEAEAGLGSHTKAGLDKDKALRARVAQTGQG